MPEANAFYKPRRECLSEENTGWKGMKFLALEPCGQKNKVGGVYLGEAGDSSLKGPGLLIP